jgi:hypothetical protein
MVIVVFYVDWLPSVGNIATAGCFLFIHVEYDDNMIWIDVNIYNSLF